MNGEEFQLGSQDHDFNPERWGFVPFFSELGSRSGELRRPAANRQDWAARLWFAVLGPSAAWPYQRTAGKAPDSNGCRKCPGAGLRTLYSSAPD